MSFDATDLIEAYRESRSDFFRHLEGMKPEQWTWKPYSGCKNVRETLLHFMVGDEMLRRHLAQDPTAMDWENIEKDIEAQHSAASNEELMASVNASLEKTLATLSEMFADKPLDTPIPSFGGTKKLGVFLSQFSNESNYHAGQVAYIRMASDPEWDYYGHIFGM